MASQQIHPRSVGALSASQQEIIQSEQALVADSISRINGGRKLLSDVSLSIRPGEITALVGPSGAGKTTLLKALSFLEPPDSGTLSVDGKQYRYPLGKQKIDPPWPTVTVVFQQLFLWPHLTLRQNITLPLGKKLDPEKELHVEHLLQRFGMNEFIDRFPNQSSLGQRQRTALVRAMVLSPKYILLDEITSSLDIEHVAKILSELRVMRDQNIGILLVTHLLGFAREAADSIVFLDGGRVIESGGKEVLINPQNDRVKSFLAMAELAS